MKHRNKLTNLAVTALTLLAAQSGRAAPNIPIVTPPTDQVVLLQDDTLSGCETGGKWQALTDEGQKNFRRASCLFHQAEKATEDQTFKLYQDTVTALRNVQNLNVSVKQQTVAAFMEGQTHCLIAKLYVNETNSLIGKGRFCAARTAAWTTLNDLDWKYVDFAYDKDETGTLYPKHFERLAACQDEGGILGSNYDAICGNATEKSDEDLQRLVDDDIMPALDAKYFQGSSPFLAIFARKQKQAEGVKVNAEAQKGDLIEDSKAIASAYEDLNDHYVEQVKTQVDEIVENYQNAAKISRLILSQYNSWMSGLLWNGTRNLGDELVGPTGKAGVAGNQAATAELVKTNQIASADLIVKMIGQLKSKAAMSKVRARNLCKAYYCSVAARDDAFTTKSSYDKACNNAPNPLLQTNVLCLGTPEVHKTLKVTYEGVAKEKTARDFCIQADVGFPVSSAKVNGTNGCPLIRD